MSTSITRSRSFGTAESATHEPAGTSAPTGLPDWLAEPARPPRGRVVRDASARVVDLPAVEELVEEPHTGADRDGTEGEDDGESGARSVAWALAYRKGFEEGHGAGLAAGREQGQRQGHHDATVSAFERYDRVLHQLRSDADRHLDELASIRDTVAAQVTELAFLVAETVVGRELALASDPGADAVRRAIAALGGPTDAVVRLNPADVDRLGATAEQLAPGASLRFVADPQVDTGDCLLESGATTVDAGVSAAMDRVRAVLGLDPIDHVATGAGR